VLCSRRPTITILTTGDELAEPGAALGPGQIHNSNSYSVPAQARRAGCEVIAIGTVPDREEETVVAVRDALATDIAVVCGGVSVGRHDHVKTALAVNGVAERFWGVALRPGRPTWFGVLEGDGEGTLVFGLPGNPVSAMVTFELFVAPAIDAMTGRSERQRPRVHAAFDAPYPKPAGRAHVVRCRLEARDDGWHARPTKDQGSHVLTSMLDVDGLAVIPAEHADVEPGERFEVLLTRAVS
jgi:molybdopterin molybdotransferase